MKGKIMSTREKGRLIETDKDFRKKLFKGLLQHVSAGYCIDSYPSLSVEVINNCLKSYPLEWPQEELEEAKRRGKVFWESVGRDQSLGRCLGNSRSWYYNMANRYGWRDKLDVTAEHKGGVEVTIVDYASVKPSTAVPEVS